MNKLLSSLFLILFLSLQGIVTLAQKQNNSVIISGSVLNHTIDSVYLNNQVTAINSKGKFIIELEIEQPKILALKIGDIQISIYSEPGKDVTLQFDEKQLDKTLLFTGKNRDVNNFLKEQKIVSQRFNQYFNKNINTYLSKLPEQTYVFKLDSLKATFLDPLQKLQSKHPIFAKDYKKEIELLFLAFLADYPILHQKNTGKEVYLSPSSIQRLSSIDVNDPQLHRYESFQRYLRNYLYQQINKELTAQDYSKSNNQRLDAGFTIIPKLFTNKKIQDKVLYEFMLNHIDNLGIKNIENNLNQFDSLCHNPQLKQDLKDRYKAILATHKNHKIIPYKKINGYTLDAHIFYPDTLINKKLYPAIAMFHGGSFYEGKPDWFFEACKIYAQQGWIAIAVEYRIADRHSNLLPEAISDGKSLVRFLRHNSQQLRIDTSRIMVTGNSAGATIALALATLDNTLDEPSENHSISSKPNAIMVNAALADLTEPGHYWWHKYYNADFIKSISPLHNVNKQLPPMLLIHGSQDNAVDISSVRQYSQEAKMLGNKVSFYELKGAPHMIWRIPYFSQQIAEHRRNFLDELSWN